MKKIIAICGSTRTGSSNQRLIEAMQALIASEIEIALYDGIAELPHFNPDLDGENPPEKVVQFRQFLRSGDAILICTPEYARGVPGSLKNAIDWTVSSCEFYHVPTALITASSLGEDGHASLLSTLKMIEADITDETQLLISNFRTKMDSTGRITDLTTFEKITSLLNALKKRINETQNAG